MVHVCATTIDQSIAFFNLGLDMIITHRNIAKFTLTLIVVQLFVAHESPCTKISGIIAATLPDYWHTAAE